MVLSLVLPLSLVAAPQERPDADLWTDGLIDQNDWSDDVPAYLATVDGDAWLERDGLVERADENTPLIAGDRLRTEAGRVEVLFNDGSALALDEDSTVEVVADTLLRLDTGRLAFFVARTSSASRYRLDAGGTTTWIRNAGEYRLSVRGSEANPTVDLRVSRGLAELTTSLGRTLVRAGTEARATAGAAPTSPYAVSLGTYTAFERWAERQREDRQGIATTTYLPTELRTYSGVFDRDGAWEYQAAYGYVWYPRVEVGWRPYADGRWSVVGRYGWTWIGAGRWSWATHHYGRWGLSGTRWYWIPERRWAPAWVSWASAPGYVGWCPLGFDNRALISVSVGYGNGWRAWSVAPARAFSTSRVLASRDLIRPGAVVDRFVVRRVSPNPPGVAMPRDRSADVAPHGPANRSTGIGTRDVRGADNGAVPPAASRRGAPTADRAPTASLPVPPIGNRAPSRVTFPPSASTAPRERATPEPADRVTRPTGRVSREPAARPAEVERQAPAERPAPQARRAAPDAPAARSAPSRDPERQAPPPQRGGGSGGQGRAQPRQR